MCDEILSKAYFALHSTHDAKQMRHKIFHNGQTTFKNLLKPHYFWTMFEIIQCFRLWTQILDIFHLIAYF